MQQWFYLNNGQQVGPVSVVELRTLLSDGTVDPETDLVWCKGMAEWLPANQVPELNPSPSTPDVDPAPKLPDSPGGPGGPGRPAPGNPYAAPAHGAAMPFGDLPRVKPAKLFVLMVALYLVGAVLAGIGGHSLLNELVAGLENWIEQLEEAEDQNDMGEPKFNFNPSALVAFFTGTAMNLAGWIMSLVYLHRAWSTLRGRSRVTTPGKAVGFLFIPIFSLYWIFVAYWKWSQEWNQMVANDPAHPEAPRIKEGLFLGFAIATVASAVISLAGFVAAIFFILGMKQMCSAVDYTARIGKESGPGDDQHSAQ